MPTADRSEAVRCSGRARTSRCPSSQAPTGTSIGRYWRRSMRGSSAFPGNVPPVDPESRDVSLTIPAKPGYLVLARLALSAVCRLTTLEPAEVADLKLAVTE